MGVSWKRVNFRRYVGSKIILSLGVRVSVTKDAETDAKVACGTLKEYTLREKGKRRTHTHRRNES